MFSSWVAHFCMIQNSHSHWISAAVWGVNVVFCVELIALKTWCGAEEVQKYSSTCFKFTNCCFLTFGFSVAKTITDGINRLKVLWNTWNPWREGSGNFVHPWFWHWTPDFQQKPIVLIWFSELFFFSFCVTLGIFLFPFEIVAHQLRWDPHTECVPSASSENEWWIQSREGEAEGSALSSLFWCWYHLWGIFFPRELGCMSCWAWIIVTYLVRRQWTFDYKGGIWNAGEEYHIDWANSHGFNVGWRIFEVLCGHFSSSHILQKLKYVSGNIHSCIDPLYPRFASMKSSPWVLKRNSV